MSQPSPEPVPQPERKTRADAECNRTRILEAARGLFAERGSDVQMAHVAREAGVGIGTVYRHFPSRQALVGAVAEYRFAAILAFARDECLPDPDPRRALACFLGRIGEVHEEGREMSVAIEAVFGTTEPRGEVGAELLSVGRTLLDRGLAAGALRADATTDDLYMIAGAVAVTSRNGVGDWRRLIEIALDGLRPDPARPSPGGSEPV